MILLLYSAAQIIVAMQQRLRHNRAVSSTLLQMVDSAQPQQVAPFF
jgi:hypothetical protein